MDKSLPAGLPGSPEVDEIIPVSKGGSPYSFSNCYLAHRWCNRIRSNHSVEWARQHIEHGHATDIKPTSMPLTT
ncbi:HNH endonuclease, partial [Bifidobacterium saguini]|uniref:HNH endonuclease n=1 Tax=Bifidobacterium saguini TaxID=762210 RepID=UPI001FB04155